MQKSPEEERRIILSRDHRRRYGARIFFRILHPLHIGTLGNVTFLLPDGTYGRIRPDSRPSWEPGVGYEVQIEAFSTGGAAEAAGMRVTQALLLTALDLDFGIRLDYINHGPSTIYDRTVSTGSMAAGMAVGSWAETIILEKLTDALQEPVRNKKLTLSMELLASSYLEANERAKFIMAVSSLEPLSESQDLGAEVKVFVAAVLEDLQSNTSISEALRRSLEGRVRQLRKESVRQSLLRLCAKWFPGSKEAAQYIEYVYQLRSQILHEGAVSDPDILLAEETSKVRRYVRRIYEKEFSRKFRVATAD